MTINIAVSYFLKDLGYSVNTLNTLTLRHWRGGKVLDDKNSYYGDFRISEYNLTGIKRIFLYLT